MPANPKARAAPSSEDASCVHPEVIQLELYVGNLPWSIDDARLSAMFSTHGNVERAKIVTDRDTGRSRGFGFITMSDDAAAQKAIAAINGTQLEGRAVTVRPAEDRAKGPRAGGAGGGGGGYGAR
jgi:cold-inducible RNA-binding protein